MPKSLSHWILGLMFASAVMAQEVDPVRKIGEITGNDVNVRSLDSQNAYVVMKLKAGKRVTILGEKFGWYKIVPPEGAFSLIAKPFIDWTEGQEFGVVNADRVNVRTGSLFSSMRSEIQLQLSSGAQVKVLGEAKGGSYKIAPPEGASVWVHGNYVNIIGNESDVDVNSTSSHASESAIEPGPPQPKRHPVLSNLPDSAEREALIDLELILDQELEKPLAQREFEPLIPRYDILASQEKEAVVQQYASIRLGQLKRVVELRKAVQSVAEVTRTAIEAAEQANDRNFVERPDARGILASSAIFGETLGPARMRLMDKIGPEGRIIAYIDVPSALRDQANALVGKSVLVFAESKRLYFGGARPLPLLAPNRIEAAPSQPDTRVDLSDN